MTKNSKGWTPERRAAQRERILKNKPWEKSTGPVTHSGKKKSSQNSFKHGLRSRERKAVRKYLREVRHLLEFLNGGRLRNDREYRYKNRERTIENIQNWPIFTIEL